jgi:ribulose-phosphate 3-epimerase
MVGSRPRGFFFHPSTVKDPVKTIRDVKALGVRAGIAINPDERTADFLPLFELIDYCLVMTVFPGFGGQSFIADALDNVRAARDAFDGDIVVDGGVSPKTAGRVAAAGGNILVAGSAVFGQKDRAAAIAVIREAGESGR